MNPADQRVTELVDKWLKSLELHLRYAALTDEAYWQVQPWVRHQRPARWILDLAHTRARDLKRHLDERIAQGDSGFAEALELMGFLANLVGAQHIERFIPLAEAERENKEVLANTQSTLKPLASSTSTQTTLIDPTREMLIPVPPPAAPPPNAAPPAPRPPAASAAPAAAVAPSPSAPNPPPATAGRASTKREPRGAAARAAKAPAPGSPEAQIVADAVRLIKWGREWHELAEAIARIAGRPGVVEVRRVLRTHKAEIERAADE